MGKAGKAGNSKARNHRCRVVLSILFNAEERSISLGPGSIVGEREYAELMEKKLATHDMFEEVAELDELEPQAAEESETK